jgi:hypothetical protein
VISEDRYGCVYISSHDIGDLLDGDKPSRIRLMELANIEIYGSDSEKLYARFISRELEDAKKMRLKIIQWVGANSVKAIIRKPEGLRYRLFRGIIERSILELNDRAFQLVRFGFVKPVNRFRRGVILLYIHD